MKWNDDEGEGRTGQGQAMFGPTVLAWKTGQTWLDAPLSKSRGELIPSNKRGNRDALYGDAGIEAGRGKWNFGLCRPRSRRKVDPKMKGKGVRRWQVGGIVHFVMVPEWRREGAAET